MHSVMDTLKLVAGALSMLSPGQSAQVETILARDGRALAGRYSSETRSVDVTTHIQRIRHGSAVRMAVLQFLQLLTTFPKSDGSLSVVALRTQITHRTFEDSPHPAIAESRTTSRSEVGSNVS